MTTFDPVESEFDFFVDPLTADTQGLAILDELEKTKQIKGRHNPELDAKQTKLKKNLTNYRDYKVNRDERLFNYAPEARARTAAMEEEKLAQTISGLFKADETTFNAFVEENGDTAWFKKGQHFMRGDSSRMRDEYLKDHILKLAGYSDRVIASGVAEPLMRARVGAKDSESEPTNEALSRWSLSKLNDMKRRKHVRDSTIAEVNKRFIGITGDVSDLPEAMEKLNPTDEERTLILRASNRHFEKLEEEYATIKPRVLKAFNTVAAQEDITSRLDADSYDNLVEAARDFSQNIPIQDFPKVVHMFAQVAEAHGEDVDSTMEKLAKSFSRGGSDLFGSAAVGYGDWFIGEFEETAKMRENKTFRSIQDAVAGVLGVEEEIKALDGGTKEARKEFDNFKAFYGELSNWREAVAKVGSDSWLVDSLVYGTARSLPEMGAAAAGIPGLMLVAAAAKERSMVEIRRDVAPGKWKKYEKVAVTSGIAYSLLNLAQFDTLSAKLPGTNSFLAEMGKRVFFEGLQESGQNLSMAFSLEFYGALDKDIEDLELKAEVWEAVKEFPKTMIAVSPLVLAGGLGQKALEYHDIKKFEKSLQDPDYLAVYGIEAEDQLVIRNLSVPDALDYIKDNNGRFLDNINGDFESSIAPPSGEVVFEEGRGVILGPRVTPDMLTRVERRLLPEEKEVADYERWKTQQGVDTGGMGMPIETMLEESYGDFLSDQLREAIGANEADGNKESIARIKAQQVFQERVQQLEKESVDESKAADDAARQAQQDRSTATAGFNARINASPDGTFSVTNGDQTMQAKSPEEAAEAAMALDPGYAKRNAAPQGDLKTAQENLRVAQEALAAEETASNQAAPDTTVAQAAVEEAQAAVDAAQAEVDTRDFPYKPPVEDVTAFRSLLLPEVAFFTDPTKETFGQMRENLPPIPRVGQDVAGIRSRFRYNLLSRWSQRPLPSRTLSETATEISNTLKGVESQFNDIAKAVDKKIKKKLKKTPAILRDGVGVKSQEQTYKALRGDAVALKKLPADIRKDIEVARESIDHYAKLIVDAEIMSKEVTKKVKGNIGKYIFRQFKAFDSKAKWGYNYVKKNEPGIYAEAVKEIKATYPKLTDKEVDQSIKEILDKTRAEEFYMGTSKAGKISASSFFKKNNDLSPAMLNLLGEVRNPAINILESGKKASALTINHAGQLKLKDQMLKMGIASTEKNADLGHTYRIGEETYEYDSIDKDKPLAEEKVKKKGKRTSKQFTGLKDTWMNPHIGKELDKYFAPVNKGLSTPMDVVLRTLATATATGKYAQVILNPISYPTNALSGIGTEVYNGRVSWDAKGARAYLNIERLRNADRDSGKPYGAVEQAKFRDQINSTVMARKGGVNSVSLVSLTAELEQGGILNSNVIAGDLKATHELAFGENAKEAADIFSKAYQVPDNRIKMSAFVHELHKYMKAYPKETVGQAVKRALTDVRGTTQNYNMVQKFIKSLSSHGVVIPTYVSYRAELIRNTINTGRLAVRELTSGNTQLQIAGGKRVAGMIFTAMVVQQAWSTLSEWMTGLGEDELEMLNALKAPWFGNKNLVYLEAKDGELKYFDPEYVVPQTMFLNALDGGYKEIEKGTSLMASTPR